MVTFTEEDFAGFTRILSSADLQALEKAEKELEKRGFDISSKENALTLLRAFDQAKHIPITFETLIKTVETYKDSFTWLSVEEAEYNKLSAQLGEQKTNALWSFFPGYRLESTYLNFNLIGNFFLAHGWNVDRDSFTKAIGNIQAGSQGVSGSRDVTPGQSIGQPGHHLEFKTTSRPTVESQRVKMEMDEKERANTPLRKVTQEEKDAAVSHVFGGGDGPGRSKPYKPVFNRPETTPQDPTPTSDSPAYWQRQVRDFLASIRENNIRKELEPEFAAPKNGNWELTFRILQNTYNRRKTESNVRSRTI